MKKTKRQKLIAKIIDKLSKRSKYEKGTNRVRKKFRDAVIGSFMIAIILILLALMIIQQQNCYYVEEVFLFDEIKESSLCDNDVCLFIHTKTVEGNRSLYFAKEKMLFSLRKQVERNQTLLIRWCEVDKGIYRVRGIFKK